MGIVHNRKYPDHTETEAYCPDCKTTKHPSEFSPGLNRGLSYCCKPCHAKRASRYYRKNRAKVLANLKISRAAAPEKRRKQSCQWQIDNKDRYLARLRQYRKVREESDLSFKLSNRLRHRVYLAIKSASSTKSSKSMDLIGCDIEFFKQYIEKLFVPGMSWDNYGKDGWHIDHIRPCASFDLNDPEQQRQCFHYTNLQPLWAKDNLTKWSKYDSNL